MAVLLLSSGFALLGASSCGDSSSPEPSLSPQATAAPSRASALPPEDAWVFTQRFFSAIGRANHQAALEAATPVPTQGPEVPYLPEELPAEELIRASSNPTSDVLSEDPPPSFGVAPPAQTHPPTADVPSPERTAEPTLEPTVEPTWEPTTEPTAEPTPQVTVGPTAQPSPEPTTQVREGPDYAFAQALLQLTNETRIANGLAPLVEDPALVAVAQKYAEIHVRLSPLQLSHSVDGSTLKDRIEREGYTGWACLGENLHLNPLDVPRTVEQTFQDWMTGAHRDNILDPNFQDIGIGCNVGMAEPYPVQICVQNFGAKS